MTSKGKGLRLFACVAITLAMMYRTVWRIMSERIRPFDWWMLGIEAAVLILIMYEVGLTIFRQIADARRRKMTRGIEVELRGFIASGETIRSGSASPGRSDHFDAAWMESVSPWITEVEKYLASRSDKALGEFRRITQFNPQQRQYINRLGDTIGLSGHVGDKMQQLNMRLDSLHRIVMRCEDYF